MKKTGLLTLLIIFTVNCYCQSKKYDITGSWTAIRGDLITVLCSKSINPPPDKPVDVFGLKFIFENSSVRINNPFGGYSKDLLYNWAVLDTISKANRYKYKVRVTFFDQNNIKVEMNCIGTHTADRSLCYEIYLKRD